MPTVLVTGASRGIGLELVRQLASRGDETIGACRDAAGAAAIEAAGGAPVTLDVSRAAEAKRLTETLEGRALDLLVCNAGLYLSRGGTEDPVLDEDEAWARMAATNIAGPMHCIRACLPALRRAERPARIAIISSKMGSSAWASGRSYIYRATKAAATNLAANLALDLREEGIAVAAYHPGWVRTDMGGGEAPLSVTQSAEGLLTRFAALDLAATGAFEAWDGAPIPY